MPATSLARVFGCWHPDLSRPLSRDGETYRTCLDCGARRHFDTDAWRMVGPYYYARVPQQYHGNLELTAPRTSRDTQVTLASTVA